MTQLPSSARLLNGKNNSFIIPASNDNSGDDDDIEKNQAGKMVNDRKIRMRLSGKPTANTREIEINTEAENIKDFFKKIAHRLLRSPSGEPSNIGLDIFPDEEEAQYQIINQEIFLQQQRESEAELDDLAHQHNQLNNNDNNNGDDHDNNNNNNNNGASIGETTIHQAYRTSTRAFRPKARCFASKAMKKYLEDGEVGKISDYESETTSFSAGRVVDPDTIGGDEGDHHHLHVPEDGRLLISGPPSVGKTRFGLMMTNSQPFLSSPRPVVYLPVDHLISSSSSSSNNHNHHQPIKPIKEALNDFFADLNIPSDEATKVSAAICDEFRSFPVVWIFDNLEILVNRQPGALEKIEVGMSESFNATLDRDAFIFLSRDGLQRETFFDTFADVTEWRMFRWNAHDEKCFIWAACGETHPFVSSITSTVLRAFESHPQLALLRGCPTTTHILTLLAMRGSNLKHVKCLSEAFELLLHLIIADEKKIKNAITAVSREARALVGQEITHLSFDASQHSKQDWFHALVGAGLLAIVSKTPSSSSSTTEEGKESEQKKQQQQEPIRVAFRNRFIAELFAHLNLFQSEDEGSKEPHAWSWECLKWDRSDRVLWTLVAGRVASRAANGNPRELFAFHAASQFFLFYNHFRSQKGTSVIHDSARAGYNSNATLCSLVVELCHHLGAGLLIQEILNQHGLYSRPPSHLRWMVPLCGRIGASETLGYLVEKLKTRGNPQPLTIAEMAETYIEAILGGQRPSFFAEMNKIIEVNFDLRQSALFGALSPLICAIEEARRTRQAQSPAFLKRVSTCLAEAEKRGDREITNALLSALPIADTLMRQFFQVGDAALSCMEARKRLWIHYAQLWHAHPTMPWESVGCFSTETLELQSFDSDGFKHAVSAGTHHHHHQQLLDNNNDQQQRQNAGGHHLTDSPTTHDGDADAHLAPNPDDQFDLGNLIREEFDPTLSSDEHLHQQQQQQSSSSTTFSQVKNKYTIYCSPVNAHEHFASKKITLIEGSPFVGKTTFGLQLCMIQPFPDHVCVYFDLRSLMLLTKEHREQQQKLFGAANKRDAAEEENKKENNGAGGFFSKLLFGGGGENDRKKNSKKNNANGDFDQEQKLPTTLQEFWKLMGLPIDERAPIMWIFDNCGRLSREVDACVLSLLSEIASSTTTSTSPTGNNNKTNKNYGSTSNVFGPSTSDTFVPPSSPTSLIASSVNSASSSPRSKDRVILLSRILRNGARYLAKDIIFSNMKTWIMPPRSAKQEAKIIYNYLQRAANISLHLANQGDGGELLLAMRQRRSTIDDEGSPIVPTAAAVAETSLIPRESNLLNNNNNNNNNKNKNTMNQSVQSSEKEQEENRHRQMAAAALAASTLDLDPTQTRDQLTDALYLARSSRQNQLQDSFHDMVSNADDANFSLSAPLVLRGSGMVLKWICRLTATMNDPTNPSNINNNNNGTGNRFPDVSDPLTVIEQEMRRRCRSAGISNPEKQTALIQTTCIAALRSLVAGFPFPVIRDKSPATDAISVADLHSMLMCQFIHAAPDLKRQECEFKASEVELFAALSLRIKSSSSLSKSPTTTTDPRRHLSLLSWRAEFEAVWLLAAASLSNSEFASVASECLDRILPAKTTGTDEPPPFVPFFLLLETSDIQPFLVGRALEIGTNLRKAHLAKKIGLSSLCGLFGAMNALRDHLVATREKSLGAYERDRMEAVVSASSYFSKDTMDDLMNMLNELDGNNNNNRNNGNNLDFNNNNGDDGYDDDDDATFGSPNDLVMNVSFAPHVIKKMLSNSNTNNTKDIGGGNNNNNNNTASFNVNNNNINNNNPTKQTTTTTTTASPTTTATATTSSNNINNNNNNTKTNLKIDVPSSPEKNHSRANLFSSPTTETDTNKNNNIVAAALAAASTAAPSPKSSPLEPISKKNFKFIKIPNGYFASKSSKIVKLIDDFDPACDKKVPFLLWIDEEDQSKKHKTKFFGIKSIKKHATDPKIFTLDLPERSVTLEATSEDDANLWFDCVQEYITVSKK